MIPIGIVGASGFTGAELLRLAAQHPEFSVRFATGDSMSGTAIEDLYPSLAGKYPGMVFEPWSSDLLESVDVVFLGLPHGASQAIVPQLIGSVDLIVDLGADFRLKTPAEYLQWYNEAHTQPELLGSFVYGLPEMHREQLQTATRIATPGCYPTAASLPLVPLVRAGLVHTDRIIVDAASGVSGAGGPPKPNTTFCAVDSDFTAYGLMSHRHTPEMEMNIGATVLFTPHLAPMSRGILATCYAQPVDPALTTEQVLQVLSDFYADEPFVVVSERLPSTKATLGSNSAHITACVDERTSTVIALCAIDNLGKGASGAAVQCANLALGLPEAAGLQQVGVYP